MPILAGIEARVVTRRSPKVQQVTAESSSRPESSRAFAKRMAGRFVLRGPRERKEGENTAETKSTNTA